MNRGLSGALCISVAIAMLAGCGGSPSPISAPGTMPQRAPTQARAHRATSAALIYAVGGCGGTCVLSFPKGKRVAQISGLGAAVCADLQGNVFISRGDNVNEYAYGGTTPTGSLSVPGSAKGCAVDPVTGNLAVVFSGGGGTNVAIFSPGSGTPSLYQAQTFADYCGYDNAGNLFVSGKNSSEEPSIAEIPYGQGTATLYSIDGRLGNPGQMQWDGLHMTYETVSPGHLSISQLTFSGSTATVVGTTTFSGEVRYVGQSWISNNSVLVPFSKKGDKVNKIGLWRYPHGGKAARVFGFKESKFWTFQGVAVSVAPSH